jgi:myxalamid-type polyketide synthase MxaC
VRLDLDPEATPADQAEALYRELRWHDGEAEVAHREGRRRVARLVRAVAAEAAPAFSADGTYLITGGLGGLGLRLAAWLAEHGARHMALMGRSTPSEEALAQITRLESRGCTLAVFTADVARREEVQRTLGGIDADLPPLRGIFHLAGVLDDGVLLQQDWSRFQKVFAAKVDGAWHLHELTRDRRLEAFVLFSTSVSLQGYAGQGNHAAANAFLDGLAHYRRGLGLPGLSINWGAWGETGSVVERQVEAQMRRQGVSLIPPDQGFAALGRTLCTGVAQMAVIPIQWQQFLRGYADRQVPPFFAEMVRGGGDLPKPAAAEGDGLELAAALASVPPERRRARLRDYVWSQAAAVLGINPAAPMDPEQPLNELGLDSLMALELRKNLGNAVGKQLPATLLFNYATVHALTDYLAGEVLKLDAEAIDQGPPDDAATVADLTEIASLTEQEMAALIDDELDALMEDA